MSKKRKIFLLIPALSFVLNSIACSSDGKVEDCGLVITKNSFGQIRLEESLHDIKNKFDVEAITAGEEEPNILQYNIKYCADTNISVNIRKEGDIFMLKSTSPSLLYHGYEFSDLTLGLLNDLIENSDIYWAQDEGKKYFFKPQGTNLTRLQHNTLF